MRIILVTGAPRSGTTLVGRIIGYSQKSNYIWEPFNWYYRKGVQDYYPYVGIGSTKEKRELYTKLTDDLLSLKNLKASAKPPRNNDKLIKAIFKKVGVNRTMVSYSIAKLRKLFGQSNRVVIKDPIAVFLTRFLIEKYGALVVACVRHPCAVALSRKRLGWGFDLSGWKDQADLWEDYILKQVGLPPDTNNSFMLSAWHWKACYEQFIHLKKMFHGNVIFLRHEDICFNPIVEFKRIYKLLDLQWSERVQNKIVYYTSGDKSNVSSPVSVVKRRDSKTLALEWKEHITYKELLKIGEITKPVGYYFYNEKAYWDL